MLGTIINSAAILMGSIIGLLWHRKFPQKLTQTAFHGIGVFTIFLGINLAFKTSNFIVMIFSIVIGSILGELINLEGSLNKFSDKLKKRLGSKNDRFSEGLLTAFLLFCMGSMTILGAIEEGLGNAPNLLLAKSILDGFSSIALAATLGIGVMFSIIPLLLYQGGLTLLTALVGDYFNQIIVDELSAVGGLMLLALGLRILEIKKIRVLNMLPSLVVVVVLGVIFLI
ncbi:MAG TPA: DUF554 domain-containing protein [Candidatus Cloacimonas sp.]|jgi:uncharacterized membrane protein YqgA involved in biofilm formation|nr:DUF554 domain-containing protein [Candidatus Cloacimonas sp.]